MNARLGSKAKDNLALWTGSDDSGPHDGASQQCGEFGRACGGTKSIRRNQMEGLHVRSALLVQLMEWRHCAKGA